MHTPIKSILAAATLLAAASGVAQNAPTVADERLKMAAIEALIAAPPERAVAIVKKVLAGDHSDELKARALFVLSQADSPEAGALLLEVARGANETLRAEAIRGIGISGDRAGIAALGELYRSGDHRVREAVMEAYLIADASDEVYQLAVNATTDEEFERAVATLGAMGAREELRRLRDRAGSSRELIHAYAVSGDVDTLIELAGDGAEPERQLQAIRALGIAGGDRVNAALVEIYRRGGAAQKEAALNGLLIAGHDQGVLELYRSSQDPAEKRQLMRTLAHMDSDAVWELIETTLEDGP